MSESIEKVNKNRVIVHKNINEFVEKCQINGKQYHRCKWTGCLYLTNRSDSIQRHMRRHTGEKPYRCLFENCSYATIQSSALKIHVRRHTGEKPYLCRFQDCNKRFTVLGTLLIHERTHTGVKPFVCESCSYATIEKSKLTAHIRKNHSMNCIEDKNRNNCNTISLENIVKTTTHLIPINIFTTISTTPCENIQVEVDVPEVTDDTVFNDNKETIHSTNQLIEVNTKENNIKAMAQYVDKREFEGKVTYVCKWKDCNYDSMRSDCVVRHIRSHTGDKPYKCHIEGCDYKTVQRSALNQHMVWHTGEKPHTCHYPNCSYKSIQRNKLQLHIRKNHLNSNPLIIESNDEKVIQKMGKFVERKRLNWFECKWKDKNNIVCNYSTIRSDCIVRHMRTREYCSHNNVMHSGHTVQDILKGQTILFY